MVSLKGKKILLGVSAGIAAYKSAVLIRLFIKAGAEVKVIMTPAAHSFITPLTLATLSKNEVLTAFEQDKNGVWNNHVDLGMWADVLLIAPATANTISKMANGICDNLLLATYLSARCPVMFAPAMDLDMFQHPSVKSNIQRIIAYGNLLIDAERGELASGLVGKGRMAEPENIIRYVGKYFEGKVDLKGKKVLVTAGPTYEAIDPVRFIGNHSSGKMGFAIAEELATRGAEVILVSGPVSLSVHHASIKRIDVTSAAEMYAVANKYFKSCHAAILSAAVADFKPKVVARQKIKKANAELLVELETTRDILASLGKMKTKNQVLVGFALETTDEEANATKKLRAKNLDFIVLNSLRDKGAGFKSDTNVISIIDKQNKKTKYPLMPKVEVAAQIVNYLNKYIKNVTA